jgi:predicted nucleic acid-binding protein
MRESVFIDTGFWIALFQDRDRNHVTAKNALKPLLRNYHILLSDFIVFETITYLNCSLKRHDLALRFLEKIERSLLDVLTVDEDVKTRALVLFKKYSDKHLSMTDCTSFVIMNRTKTQKYAGFDDHFSQMGFIGVLE